MGLFTKRQQTVAAEGWQPDGTGVAIFDGTAMDDQGCAGDHAYSAGFTLASAPAASITIYTYPVYGPQEYPEAFVIGYRCDYQVDTGRQPWMYAAYDGDEELYPSLQECDRACRDQAEALATTPRTGPSEDDLQFFDWDGVPQ